VIDKDSKNSKQLILETAAQVFAEKGFDGARVDEIAKRAQVNKALIYYYFESKDKILEELMAILIKELIDFKDNLGLKQSVFNSRDLMDENKLDFLLVQSFQFYKNHQMLLNIILSETLKGATNKDVFFKMLNLGMEDTVERIKSMNGEINNFEEFITIAVFFLYMPMLSFITFGQKWAEFNQLDYSAIDIKFHQTFKKVYKEYFLSAVMPRD
jgi:AcrR family transcriptional regulator